MAVNGQHWVSTKLMFAFDLRARVHTQIPSEADQSLKPDDVPGICIGLEFDPLNQQRCDVRF